MKKLKLNLKDVGEILTREQLKQVFGGSGEPGGSGDCFYKYCHCTRHPGSWGGTYCSVEEFNQALNNYCEDGLAQCN